MFSGNSIAATQFPKVQIVHHINDSCEHPYSLDFHNTIDTLLLQSFIMMNGGLAPTDSTISHKNPLQMCEKEGKAPGERLPSTIKCFENAKTTHVMIKQKRGNASSLASSPKPWQISVEARGMAQTGWGHDSVPGDSSEYGASCSTGLDPPITRESLSELDLPRILNHLSLRHDLNFDREISFRSNMSGPRGRQRAKQAFEYWDAMAAELAVWFDYRQIPLRLPRMFGAVRQILKTLIPAQEWPEIDIWLDIESLMQGMRNGSFNFTALIEWLGALLRRSCSPVRDHLVDLMISTTERGMQRADPCLITDGLLHLFGILERMRLVRDFPKCLSWELRGYLIGSSGSPI